MTFKLTPKWPWRGIVGLRAFSGHTGAVGRVVVVTTEVEQVHAGCARVP